MSLIYLNVVAVKVSPGPHFALTTFQVTLFLLTGVREL